MPRCNPCGKIVTPSKHLSSGEPDDAKVSSPVRRGVCGKVSERITRHFPTLLYSIPLAAQKVIVDWQPHPNQAYPQLAEKTTPARTSDLGGPPMPRQSQSQIFSDHHSLCRERFKDCSMICWIRSTMPAGSGCNPSINKALS